MNLRDRAKRVQEPMLKFLSSPTAMMLPHDARTAFAELVAFVGELAGAVEQLQGEEGKK